VYLTQILHSAFAALAEKKGRSLPYSPELAGQRVSFGRTLLARARDSIPRQADFEAREEAKASRARDAREATRQAQAAAEVRPWGPGPL
jgi:hypothetical protein